MNLRGLVAPAVGLAVALLSIPARASVVPTATDSVCLEARTPEELRQRLQDLARQRVGRYPTIAADAYYIIGRSWNEGGERDSALAWLQRSVALRGGVPERAALADIWLASGDAAAAGRALDLLRGYASTSGGGTSRQQSAVRARLGWAHFLAGHPDSALTFLSTSVPTLKADEWTIRWAQAELDGGDAQKCSELLLDLVAHGPLLDPNASRLLEASVAQTGSYSAVEAEIDRRLQAWRAKEESTMKDWRAEAAAWNAPDGFRLHGTVLPRRGKGRRPGVLVLRDFTSPLEAYDSLVTGLNRQGYAVLLMEPRGMGRSRDTTMCAPYAWWGREERMRDVVAADVASGLTVLGAQPLADSTAMVVVGSRETAAIVTAAAARDPRVKGVVLITPRPSTTQVGPLRAATERLRAPCYFQTAPEEFDYTAALDALYRATDPKRSRLVDCKSAGSGPELFQRDARVRTLLGDWLRETLAAASPKR